MIYPIILCTIAGLSTAIGGLIVVINKGISNEKMSLAQGFAAGVMLTVSFLDLFIESFEKYSEYNTVFKATTNVIVLIAMGWLIGYLLTKLVVPTENLKGRVDTKRLAMITSLVIILHNLPEGMLTMFTSSQDINLGLKMSLAIALHNIPEGIAVASSIYFVSKNRLKAIFMALIVGMAEPVGGILSYLILHNIINTGFINGLMSIIGGIMIQASICELIPSAIKISNIKHTIYGIIIGSVIMSIGIFVI